MKPPGWGVLLVGSTVPARAAGQTVSELPATYSYPEPAWSPYLVGALIGLLACATLAMAKQKVSASSAYADLVGMVGRLLAPRHIGSLRYFREHPPGLGWTVVFVAGTIGGAWLAAYTGGEVRGAYLQDLWVARFGPQSEQLRTVAALGGGAIMALGARIAGGCTSGHGISGALQLAVSSWIALACFFAGGAVVASLLYRL